MSDYIVHEGNTIQYDLKPQENGWILSVGIPSKTSLNDQATVLEWLRRYQKDVKRQHPHWLTSFRETDRGYALVIQKAENVHELVNAIDLMSEGNRVRDYWSKRLEYAG
jgi:hypothetical protein